MWRLRRKHRELEKAFTKALNTHLNLQNALEEIMALDDSYEAAKDIALKALAKDQRLIHGSKETE